MSRSKVALLGAAGIFGAALLVTPLVSQTGAPTPPAFSTGYNPLLSEASCAETDSQLALTSRPTDDTVKLALANEEEIAFLEGVEPAGGGGSSTETGGDGPSEGNLFDQILGELDDTQKGKKRYDVANLGGPTGGFGPTGFSPSFAPMNGKPDPDPQFMPDPNNPGGDGGDGKDGNKDKADGDDSGCPVGVVCLTNGTDPSDDTAVAVPEPASLGLLAFGIGLLAARRRRSA